MSNSRDLLKEAIADAKSVKEAAIANAKAALEEAFTPYLQEKFAAKLAEIEMEEEDKMEEVEITDENYGEDGKIEDKMEEAYDDKMEEADKMDELNLEELLAELEEEERTKDMKEETEESLTEAEEEETEEEESEEGEDTEIDLEDMSEEDLKSLIEDVIADMVKTGELEAGENFEAEESDEEEVDIDIEDEKSEEEEVSEILKEEEINEDMTQTLEFIRDSAPEVMNVLLKIQDAVGVNPGTAIALAAATAGVAIPSMIGLDLKKGEEGKSKILNTIQKVGDGAKKLLGMLKGAGTTKGMEEQLEELASTLSEVKLLNAKLLYTNKIFRAKNLNETQKVKVLEAFDKAASVRDAKLIYETLTTVKETKTAVT